MNAGTFSTVSCRDATAVQSLDEFVRSHAQGAPYHLNAWRLAVEQTYGYPGMALVAHAADGSIAGLLPLCLMRGLSPGQKWVSLPYCDLGGPLATSPEVAQALLERARADMAVRGIARLDLRCTMQAGADPESMEGKKVRMLFDLPDSAEQLMASYTPKLRSQIRKAEKNGLSFEVAQDGAGVDEFYEVYARNMHRLGSPPHSRRWFAAIYRNYAASGDIVVGLVRHGAKVVGAGMVLRAGPHAAIPWASTLADFNHLAPNMLLYWGLQSHLVASGARAFDFGRSTMGEGTYRFKRQWGAAPCELDWQQWSASGRETDQPAQGGGTAARIRPLVESAWQRLPLALANAMGARLRKYITL